MKIIVGVSQHKPLPPENGARPRDWRAAARCPWTGTFFAKWGRTEKEAIELVVAEIKKHREALRATQLKEVEVEI